jgi:hypothetical protein
MFHKVATVNFICNFYSITDSEMKTSAEVRRSLNNNTKPSSLRVATPQVEEMQAILYK